MQIRNRFGLKWGWIAVYVLQATTFFGCGNHDDVNREATLESQLAPTATTALLKNEGPDTSEKRGVDKSKATSPIKVEEPASKPHKCLITVNVTSEKELSLAGYGATLLEAQESAMEAALGIEMQLLAPKLFLPLLARKGLKQAAIKSLRAVVQQVHPGVQGQLAALFFPYRERKGMACKPMLFPSDRIPQWRSTWQVGDTSVMVIGTSPTAVIEEARAKACYGQLADAMVKASNKFLDNPSSKKKKQLKAAWMENALKFGDCFAQRPSARPYSGPSRWELKHSVQCSVELTDVFSAWQPQKGELFRVAMVASRVDRARHMARQELRHMLFYQVLSHIALQLANTSNTATAKSAIGILVEYWQIIRKVSSMEVGCKYTGDLIGIEWAQSKDADVEACRDQHPWTIKKRLLRQDVAQSLQVARQKLCAPIAQYQLKKIKALIRDGDALHQGTAIGDLGRMLRCYQSCRQNVLYSFENNPLSPTVISNVELPKSK